MASVFGLEAQAEAVMKMAEQQRRAGKPCVALLEAERTLRQLISLAKDVQEHFEDEECDERVAKTMVDVLHIQPVVKA